MPLVLYKLVHLIGLILVFAQMGGAVVSASQSGSSWKRQHAIMHGLGLFLLLLGGFGMMAKLEISFPWPVWLWVKLTIWVLIGASGTFIRKAPQKARMWLFGGMLLGFVAAYMALYKPF